MVGQNEIVLKKNLYFSVVMSTFSASQSINVIKYDLIKGPKFRDMKHN